jgi:hypothetical protein
MSCQEIEAIITDLARNTVVETQARERALDHAKECPRCGERLAAERRLTEGLLAWSAASMEEQAPARVEERLREAFRQQPEPARRGWGWLKIAAAGAIAAAAILWIKLPSPPPVAPPLPPAPAHVAVVQAPAPVESIVTTKTRQANRLPHLPRRRPAPTEIATEFLPVAQDDGWTPRDGGRLVRVKLPRSALGVFGLPVDEERAPERVQADVMLSNDGVLRAIRFVR